LKKILAMCIDGLGNLDDKVFNNMPNLKKLYDKYSCSYLNVVSQKDDERYTANDIELGYKSFISGRIIDTNKYLIKNTINGYKETKFFNEFTNEYDKNRVHIIGMLNKNNCEYYVNLYNMYLDLGFKSIYFHFLIDSFDEINSSLDYLESVFNNNIGFISTICGTSYINEYLKGYLDLLLYKKGFNVINIQKSITSSMERNLSASYLNPLTKKDKGNIVNDDFVFFLNDDKIINDVLNGFLNYDDLEIQSSVFENIRIQSLISFNKKVDSLVSKNVVDNSLFNYFSLLDITQNRIYSEELPEIQDYLNYGLDKDSNVVDSLIKRKIENNIDVTIVSLTKKIISAIEKDFDFIFVDYPNVYNSLINGEDNFVERNCQLVDACLGKIYQSLEDNFYKIIIFSSCSCDEKFTKVPFILGDEHASLASSGNIIDIAPTILEYCDIVVPKEMTGISLLK
jgi:bisphosphoglycerate-independent phosphoglycerate mutase (AlkP superfamily)